MPKCHKIYPNCIWQVPPEWFGSTFNSALPTNVYSNYATHIVSVCFSPLSPINLQLHPFRKCNIQVKFGSRAMASLYELLCHHSLTTSESLLEELLPYLPTRLPSHVCDYIPYESLIMNPFIQSTLHSFNRLFRFCILFRWFNLLFLNPSYFTFLFFVQPQDLPGRQAIYNTKGPTAENDRRPRRRLEGLNSR